MEPTLGTGTYIPTGFMRMHSLHSAIGCGGIGDIIPTVPDGVGDGLALITDGAAIIPVTGAVTTVAGMAATGDIITIIMDIIPDGVAVITGQVPIPIITIVALHIREDEM